MKTPYLIIGWGLFVTMLISGCGYRFLGADPFPFGIEKIFVEILENRTSETGIEAPMTSDLIYEFTRSGRVDVTSKDQADAILSGTIVRTRVSSISRRSLNDPVERRVTLTMNLTLASKTGRVLWRKNGISASEAYEVRSEKLATERNRRNAIEDLSKRISERVYALLSDLE